MVVQIVLFESDLQKMPASNTFLISIYCFYFLNVRFGHKENIGYNGNLIFFKIQISSIIPNGRPFEKPVDGAEVYLSLYGLN